MEFENRFWINSHLPTGYIAGRRKYKRRKIFPEEEYDNVRKMRNDGLSVDDIALRYACSPHSVRNVLRQIREIS